MIAVTVLRWTRYALDLDDQLRAFAETSADGPARFCGRLCRVDALPDNQLRPLSSTRYSALCIVFFMLDPSCVLRLRVVAGCLV
jgi:hypothetical protein